jgi:hypothetical protein
MDKEIENMEKRRGSNSDKNYKDTLLDLCPIKKPLPCAVKSFVGVVYGILWFVARLRLRSQRMSARGSPCLSVSRGSAAISLCGELFPTF